MIDPIGNTLNPRDTVNQARQQPTSGPSVPARDTNLAPDQRVEVVHPAVEKLIKRTLPGNTKLQVEKDKELGTFIYRSINPETGEVVRQWPSEELLAMREYLKEMEGVLLDTQA